MFTSRVCSGIFPILLVLNQCCGGARGVDFGLTTDRGSRPGSQGSDLHPRTPSVTIPSTAVFSSSASTGATATLPSRLALRSSSKLKTKLAGTTNSVAKKAMAPKRSALRSPSSYPFQRAKNHRPRMSAPIPAARIEWGFWIFMESGWILQEPGSAFPRPGCTLEREAAPPFHAGMAVELPRGANHDPLRVLPFVRPLARPLPAGLARVCGPARAGRGALRRPCRPLADARPAPDSLLQAGAGNGPGGNASAADASRYRGDDGPGADHGPGRNTAPVEGRLRLGVPPVFPSGAGRHSFLRSCGIYGAAALPRGGSCVRHPRHP